MEEMPSLYIPVQRLKVAILPLDLPCCGPVTHSGEILTTGKSRGKVISTLLLKYTDKKNIEETELRRVSFYTKLQYLFEIPPLITLCLFLNLNHSKQAQYF